MRRIYFHCCKACWKLVGVRRVHFDHHKSGCRRLVEGRKLSLNYCKAYRKLAKVQLVRFDNRKVCSRLAEVWRVCCDYRKSCWRLVEVQRVRINYCKVCRKPLCVEWESTNITGTSMFMVLKNLQTF